MKRYSWKYRVTKKCSCCNDWMKNISSYFRLGVGSLIQFYLKLDMAERCCLDKNYEWPSFGNHRYSHGPNVKTVSWHNLNSPTNCLKPPFYGNYRHKTIQDPKFQVIRSINFEVPRYRFSPLTRAMSHRVPRSTRQKSNFITINNFSWSEMDFRISGNFSKMKTFMSLIFRGLSFEK